ncbi:hypothetical protein DPQ25_13535 [Hydrogeniiclostridium mannosilyticum]|uniref:Uncharacterized protein n=1 Tax=Hydrogeniiclostridium mannosilyticum TaxID=2764322 RepID=A0A328UAT4_9FIRM|nr:hypothetical protein DPQ25_13535 [Hydrogeniiclostridium mannosilyticum]
MVITARQATGPAGSECDASRTGLPLQKQQAYRLFKTRSALQKAVRPAPEYNALLYEEKEGNISDFPLSA